MIATDKKLKREAASSNYYVDDDEEEEEGDQKDKASTPSVCMLHTCSTVHSGVNVSYVM